MQRLVGMEACGSIHHWARKLTGMVHVVKLMAPQYVKPYVKTNKNDGHTLEETMEQIEILAEQRGLGEG